MIFISGIVLTVVIVIIRQIIGIRYLLKQKTVTLELTPPAFLDRKPRATTQMFSVLHNLGLNLNLADKLLNRKTVIKLSIVSTRKGGIRYLVKVPAKKSESIERIIHGYLPEVRIKRTEQDFSFDANIKKPLIINFRQSKHFAYPLKNYDFLETNDPISYLTTAMTQLNDNEIIIFQLMLLPIRLKEAGVLSRKILNNQDIADHLNKRRLPIIALILNLVNKLLLGTLSGVTEVFHGPSDYASQMTRRDMLYKHEVASKIIPARFISQFEQFHIELIAGKLNQPLFRTSIKALIVADNKHQAKKRAKAVESAMTSYSVEGYQSLVSHIRRLHQLYAGFNSRIIGRKANVLSVSEIASLYHFPHSYSAKTENVIKSLSKTLPAPVSLKNNTKLDVILGINKYHGVSTEIGITEAERQRHVYVIGGTGNGKTTMLQYAAVQDIQNGKGIAVIDPHGDFAETILKHIPEDRIKDVIYINPDDLGFPVGINLLEIPEGTTGDDLLREKDLITESVVSVFRKIFSEDDSGGHRIEYVLRNAVLTALTLPDCTLFTVLKLLNNATYRDKISKGLEDEDLRDFWDNELGKAGEFQRVKMSAGITSKVSRFRQSAFAYRILSQTKSTIDFDSILDSKKILICNFSRGRLGEDNSTLFGTTILAKLQMAALRRARQEQAERQPFYLYVDEFQHFATTSFIQMLSEARKYKLFLTIAEQSTAQQEQQRMVNIILANVGTVICFRSSSPADEMFILPIFRQYLNEGAIADLPSYNFYIKIAAVQPQEPISGETLLLDGKGSEEVMRQVIVSSRELYGKEYVEPLVVVSPKIPLVKNTNTRSYNKRAKSTKY